MLLPLVAVSASATPELELGAVLRSPCPAVRFAAAGGALPALGVEAGVVTWEGPVALRLGGSLEGWYERWTWNDEPWRSRFGARGEGRLSLHLSTLGGARPPRAFATIDLGAGVAGAAVERSLGPWGPTLGLRPALHLATRQPLWIAIDGRLGTRRSGYLVECETDVPCASFFVVPGGTSVGLLVGVALEVPWVDQVTSARPPRRHDRPRPGRRVRRSGHLGL